MECVTCVCVWLGTMWVDRPGLEGVFICNLMRINRWSEQSVVRVCQEHEVMRGADETSGKLGQHLMELLWVCPS